MPPPDVREVADAAALSRAAADLIATAAAAAVAARGRFALALSGGSTPRALYQLLATGYADRIPWDATRLYFGDERCVPPDDADSNYRMADEALLSRIPGLRDRTERIEGERGPLDAAARYDAVLKRDFGDVLNGTFDIALLGIGLDGHVASLFPGSPVLEERTRWAAPAEAPPSMKTRQRVTITYPVFNNSRTVIFLCAGADKHRILSEVLAGAPYPATRITARDQVIVLADRAALAVSP